MGFKKYFSEKSMFYKLMLLFFLIFISVIIHSALAIILVYIFSGFEVFLLHTQDLSSQTSVNYLKFLQIFSGIGFFITPVLIYSYLTDFNLKFSKISRQNILLALAIMLIITPFITQLLKWNMMIPFPEWTLIFDNNSDDIIDAFLRMNNFWDLLYTLITLAIVPAIGEEMFFRGCLQKKLGHLFSNINIAIFVTAFIFSFIHLQFQAFIPRFVLGLVLGYFYFWSSSLWLSIIAHFLNNAFVVILSFMSITIGVGSPEAYLDQSYDFSIVAFSLLSTIFLLYILFKNTRFENS